MQGVFRDLFDGAVSVGGVGVALQLVNIIVGQSSAYTLAPTLQGFKQASDLAAQYNNTQALNLINQIQTNTLQATGQISTNVTNALVILGALLPIPIITLVFAITLSILMRITAVAGAVS